MCLISIIIPTFNNAHSITKSVNSVLNQNCKDVWELIIVDDGSTDNTREAIASFLPDERILYFYKENGGVCAARNFGVGKSSGGYILFLDADDTLYLDAVANFIKVIYNNPDLGICSAAFFDKRLDKVVYPAKEADVYLNKTVNIVCGSYVVQKNLFIEAGQYDVNITHSENWELFIRLVRTCDQLNLNTQAIETVSFTYNNQYTPGQIEKKITDKYNTYKYFYEKYSGKGVINKKVVSNFGEIIAFNASKKMEIKKMETLKWQFQALRQYPWNPSSYLRLVKYIFLP